MNLINKNIFFVLLWFVLLVFLQSVCRFHFYHIEQYQLFLFDSVSIGATMEETGGFGRLAAEFLTQFFICPYMGAVITASLLTFSGILTYTFIKRIDKASNFICLLSLLPVLSLLLMHFDFNYFVQGTVSYLLCLFLFNLYFLFRTITLRVIYSLVATFFLFRLCGSVAVLFAFLVLIKELVERPRKSYLFLILGMETAVLIDVSVRYAFVGEYRMALLPDMYYHRLLKPPAILYLSWLILPLIIMLVYSVRSKGALSGRKKTVCLLLQFLAAGVVSVYGVGRYVDFRSLKYKEMEYYSRTKQFGKVMDMNRDGVRNYLYGCMLNLSLAERGILADSLFTFEQNGPQSLIVRTNHTHAVTMLLSDIYYAMGHTGAARNMAFEANVSSPGHRTGRMLQRLVETSLIYGEFAVAEKYIRLLEKTYYYRKWAKGMRRYLYDEAEIGKNPELNKRKKSLPENDFLFTSRIQDKELICLSENNPENRVPLEYAGTMYLLAKNLDLFNELIHRYGKTEALPVLPLSFQEAVIVMNENNSGSWENSGVSGSVITRFEQYRKFIIDNKHNPHLAELVKRSYGNTYWYYFMFKNNHRS